MGFLGFSFGKKDGGAKKPKKRYEVNPGTYKVQVHDTNNTQDLLRNARSRMMQGTSGITIALCERTPEQIESGHPDEHCINVCEQRSKSMTFKNYLGYIDADRAHAGYLKQLVEEYQLVEAHAYISEKDGIFRMNVLLQPPENRKKKKKKQ